MVSVALAVVVVLSVLGPAVGGGGAALPGVAPGEAVERAVGPHGAPVGPAAGTPRADSRSIPVAEVSLQPATPDVRFEDQTSDGRTVTVASVTLPDGGFVTVHDETVLKGETVESIRGTSRYLRPGTHSEVVVELDRPIARSQPLVAVAYRDTDGDGVYDYVSSRGREDGPYETDRGGLVADGASVTVRAPNEPPTAALRYSPTDPRPGETVVFDGLDSEDDGQVVYYEWEVRDAESGALVAAFDSDDRSSFEFAFREPGPYDVSLTVTDDDGATDTATETVRVRENEPPTAAFELLPVDPEVGERVSFDGTLSTDDRGVVSYLWDLDGDGQFERNESRVAHAYRTVGRHPVTLLVADGEGATDRLTRTVVVSGANTPPTAAFEVTPAAPPAGAPVEFDASASDDPDPDGSVVSYRWAVDGTVVGTDDAPRFPYEFPAPGTYDVTLTVTDDEGATARRTERVVVGEARRPPTAAFELSPPVPTVGERVAFDATDSTDDGEIIAYRWDLDGDGEFESAGRTVERRYPGGGARVVTLLVVDDDGETDTANATLRVNEPPVPVVRIDPVTPRPGESVTLDGSGSTDDRRVAGYAWDLDDDGEFETTGPVVRHEFGIAGDHRVRLSVTDDDGASATTTRTVTVLVPPTERATPGPVPPASPTPSATPGRTTPTPTAAAVPPDGRDGWPLPGSPGDAAVVGGTAAAVALLVLFREEVAVLVRDLGLPRTTPRRGGRSRPARETPGPEEDEREEDEEPNRPPTAAIRHRPEEPTAGRPVRFDGLGSVDTDGRVVAYRWSVGEGPDRTGAVLVHVFEDEGEHEVTLTVEDDDGATGQTTATVEVEPGEGELALADVHPDSPGRDHESLHLEYLTFENVGEGPLDVEGWTVHDAAEEEDRVREGEHTFEFLDPLELDPGATVTVHTGERPADAPADTDTEHHRYWGRTWPVWNNEGDVVVVKDEKDDPVLAARYERVGDGYEVEPIDPERLELLFPDVRPPADDEGSGAGET